ncbi:MAG TPA: flippase, partial [Chloroflexi bacterium]|nr:flippase [Chloroflexota bacterium]
LFYLLVRKLFIPRLEADFAFQRQMLDTSFPLMINHLLATVFFRIDVLILQPLKGDAVVGYYGAAYKYIDGLNIIPAYFTMAIFPIMSRYAASAKESLMRAYILALRLLLIVSIPIAVGTTFIAKELILILGGSEYLPHSMIALQLLIWFLPLSYINSVTQYVLIAIDQQRFLTKAFLIGVAFNIVANLIFIPRYSYQAAAVVTIFSELALLIPFYYCVRKHIGSLPWPELFWRPSVASAVMAVILWVMRDVNILVRVPAAAIVYFAALLALGAFSREEIAAAVGAFKRQFGGLRETEPRFLCDHD